MRVEEERFKGWVTKGLLKRDGNCIVWTGGVNGKGRPTTRVDGKTVYISRWLWEWRRGIIKGQLNHRCDNKRCVNLNHLYDGTQKENTQDWKERQRSEHFPRCGHPRERNTYTFEKNGRTTERCHECLMERDREYRRLH